MAVVAALALGTGGPVLAGSAPTHAAPATRLAPDATTSPALQAVALVNQRRAQAGLPALSYNGRLGTAAQAHSNDMARYSRLSHIGSDGSTVGVRLRRAGYRWSRVTENIAAGYTTPSSVVTAWMNSSGHRANILDRNVTAIGIALAYSRSGRPYWTMVAARPYSS